MRLSCLIAELERLRATHGDLPVWVEDADTSWLLELTVEVDTTVYAGSSPPLRLPHVRLCGSYDAPSPDFAAYAQGASDGPDPR